MVVELGAGEAGVTPSDVEALACGCATLQADVETRGAVERSHSALSALIAERRRIYGVTTGYGPLAGHTIDPEASARLQRNLIAHLRTGTGPRLDSVAARAVLVARIASLARGHSGVDPVTFQTLIEAVNRGLVPAIPSQGTVGASGDLTLLAHLAGVLMGEGEAARLCADGDGSASDVPVPYPRADGEWRPAAGVLAELDLTPLAPYGKDALALVNGTSAMTGIACLNAVRADRLGAWALRLQVAYAEVLGGHAEAWDPALARLRPHPGQVCVTRVLGELAGSSRRLRGYTRTPPRLPEGGAPSEPGPLPQDAYSLRCAPQLFGAAADALAWHAAVVTRELNSVTDNPIVLPATGDEGPGVVHGGNFQGQHVALASDQLTTAVLQMAIHAERRIARLCDPVRNGGLPAFLTAGEVGLDSGFMGAQVTATALVAEMRTRAVPASVQSIPTNADNQDVVSMGTIAARNAAWMLEQFAHILAIEAVVVAQAMELTTPHGNGNDGWSRSSTALHAAVRHHVALLHEDRPLYAELDALAIWLIQRPADRDLDDSLIWVPGGD